MAVQAYVSMFNQAGRIHLDRHCDGLDHVDSERITIQTMASLRAIGRQPLRLPCRRCALEPFLMALFERPLGSKAALVAVASTAAINRRTRDDGSPSDTGVARLERLASFTGWQITSSEIGPVVWGVTTRPNATLIGRNLYTLVVDNRPEWRRSDIVACAVSLAVDRHGVKRPPHDANTVWHLAEAICV